MYSSPDIDSSPRPIPAKATTWPAIAGLCCIGLVLFAIAATIVLALIPIYLSNHGDPANANAFRSKDITMQVEIQENNNGRRKRLAGDLYSIVGGTFGDEGKEMVRQILLGVLPRRIVRDVVVLSCVVGYKASNRKKRFAISKRADDTKYIIVLVIEFYIIFENNCFYQCQLTNGASIRALLYSAPEDAVLQNVPIFMNDVFFVNEIRIIFISIIYVSEILPGSGTAIPGPSPEVATFTSTVTPTTTSASVTQLLG